MCVWPENNANVESDMKTFMKISVAATSLIAVTSTALYFAIDSYLNTNYLQITNQSMTDLCVRATISKGSSVSPKQSKKMKFKVRDDGSFSLNQCDSKTPSYGIGYFTPNDPRCHIVTFVDENQIIYKTVPVKNC